MRRSRPPDRSDDGIRLILLHITVVLFAAQRFFYFCHLVTPEWFAPSVIDTNDLRGF